MLMRKRTFSSYTCCSCSFIAHFSLVSLLRNIRMKVRMTLMKIKRVQLRMNQPDLYQGGSTVRVRIS